MRLIDADALKELLQAWQYEAQELGAEINNMFASAIIAQVDAMPTIEPEPCEDAISREEAKWVVFCNRDHVEDQANAIDELPSVTPKQKTGEWLPDNTNYIEERYICSKCKRSHKVETCMGKPMWDFCPSCGKRMSGGES